MHNYDLFMLMYGRDHHNIVKQLSSNKKYEKKLKKSIPVKQQYLISLFPSLFLRQISTPSPASITPSISLHETERQINWSVSWYMVGSRLYIVTLLI